MQPRTQASRSRQNMPGEKVQNESQIPIRQSQQVLPQEATLNRPWMQTGQKRQTEPGLPEQTIDSSMSSNYVVGIPTSGQAAKGNTIPNSLSDVEFSVPTQQGDEVVRTPGQATILVQTPNQNEGVKVTERDPGLREDALIVEQPHNQPQVNLSQTISKNASQTAPESTAAVEAASKNDYYETPLESSRKSIRPNFFPSIFGKRSNPTKGKTTRGNSNVLLDAEKSAGNLDSSYGLDAQTGENEINRDFVNNDLVLAVVYESGVGLGYRQRNFAVA